LEDSRVIQPFFVGFNTITGKFTKSCCENLGELGLHQHYIKKIEKNANTILNLSKMITSYEGKHFQGSPKLENMNKFTIFLKETKGMNPDQISNSVDW